ncbi:unnamed protein product, partial [Rotaria sordida]
NTPPAKRHHSQPNPGVNERNALGIQSNGKKNFTSLKEVILQM